MKFLVAFSCLLAVACAKPGFRAPFLHSVAPAHSFGYSTYSSHVAAPYAATYSAVAPVAHAYSSVAPIAYTAAAPIAHAYAAPIAHAYSAIAPVATTYSAVAPVAVAGLEKTQYHAQDEFGQASYGHAEAFQSHNAVQDAAGNKVGAFSHVAPNGQVFTTNYVADALGYRVASNALPVAPAVPLDTPEVVAARAAHLHEVEVAKTRTRRSAVFTPVSSPLAYSAYSSPLAYSAYSTPLVHSAYSTPLVHSAHRAYSNFYSHPYYY